MKFRTNFCLLATATIFSLTIAQTQAATTGLWLFDSMTTTDGGDQFADGPQERGAPSRVHPQWFGRAGRQRLVGGDRHGA